MKISRSFIRLARTDGWHSKPLKLGPTSPRHLRAMARSIRIQARQEVSRFSNRFRIPSPGLLVFPQMLAIEPLAFAQSIFLLCGAYERARFSRRLVRLTIKYVAKRIP